MKTTFHTATGIVSLYTEPEVMKAICTLVTLPSDASVVMSMHCSVGEMNFQGSPIELICRLQALLYAVAQQEGFEGVMERSELRDEKQEFSEKDENTLD